MRTVQAESVEEDPISQTVVKAVAEAKEEDPIELTPPLYDVIDPDALDRLFADEDTQGTLVFTYNNCEVSVFAAGYVLIDTHGDTHRS